MNNFHDRRFWIRISIRSRKIMASDAVCPERLDPDLVSKPCLTCQKFVNLFITNIIIHHIIIIILTIVII